MNKMFERIIKVLVENSELDGKFQLKDGLGFKDINGRNASKVERLIEESSKIRINTTITLHDKDGKASDVVIAMGSIEREVAEDE